VSNFEYFSNQNFNSYIILFSITQVIYGHLLRKLVFQNYGSAEVLIALFAKEFF